MKHRIAIFASGGGSNARKILEHFEHHSEIEVGLIISNKRNAGVLEHAQAFEIPIFLLNRNGFYESDSIIKVLDQHGISHLVLAGFLWLVPKHLVKAFPDRIVNIHPALLPKYGGKGMYGHHVHEAVKAAGEKESGITIHLVNEKYDDGASLFQTSCALEPEDSPEDIARKVLSLEHRYFPEVIEAWILGKSIKP